MARILLVNKFYYPRGGDCTALLSQERLLKAKGHDVALFSSQYEQNLPTVWDAYFPASISFSNGGIKDKLKAVSRLFFPKDVKQQLNRLFDDFQPEIVHVHNIHSYLSPYVIQLAAKKGIKVIWTLHDYKLLCPAYTCLRGEQPCELCFHSKRSVLTYNCMKNDWKASVLAYLEAKVWNRETLENYTDTFICPSHFMQQKMIEGGFLPQKTVVLHNFFDNSTTEKTIEKSDYYCYIGRISPEKGIDTLLQAAEQLPFPLKIVGGGDKLSEYQQKYKGTSIEFLGYLPHEDVLPFLRKARFSVVPSEWYENNPFSIIESLCVGTPVLGTQMGGIPELIDVGENGFLFPPHNPEMLKQQISNAFNLFTSSFNYEKVSMDAMKKFDSELFYTNLMKIYDGTYKC